MELQNKRLGGFRPIYHTLLRQEETLESIVPDALPDITRIIGRLGRYCSGKRRQWTEASE